MPTPNDKVVDELVGAHVQTDVDALARLEHVRGLAARANISTAVISTSRDPSGPPRPSNMSAGSAAGFDSRDSGLVAM